MKAISKDRKNAILMVSPFSDINYQRAYSVTSLILLFFSFSMVGWVWEVILHIIEDGMIINRGLLVGPWLPIYGSGCILILVVLRKWRDRPLCTFGLIFLLCGIIEYGTSVILESLFHARWWDYSDILFNLNGRICLEGLFIFGIGGLAFIYLAAPKVDDLLLRLSPRFKTSLCIILCTLFALDFIRACISPNMGFGITT